MAKKTYKTYHLKGLQVILTDKDGRTIEVNFSGGVQIDSTAKFSTNDEELQNALEKCNGFNRDFYLENVREENTSEDAGNHEANGSNGSDGLNDTAEDGGRRKVAVADKSDAIEWLKEHNPEAGYTVAKLRTKEAFDAACKDCGVEFEYKS